jgi:outer membrane receptor protein involved in Fe transport
MTIALWRLDLASELVFVGDAGTTEPGRSSTRTGVEWSAYVRLTPWLTADADIAWSHARFDGDDPAGNQIPGSLQTVVAAGLTVDSWRRLSGSARLRYFGPRPLIEDGSVQSESTTLVNVEAGYALSPRVRLVVDVFNLFDRPASDIDYFYTSRLPGEAAGGVDDIHTHPAAPRTLRLGVRVSF